MFLILSQRMCERPIKDLVVALKQHQDCVVGYLGKYTHLILFPLLSDLLFKGLMGVLHWRFTGQD